MPSRRPVPHAVVWLGAFSQQYGTYEPEKCAKGQTEYMPRSDHEPPEVTAHRGWRYHHVGIPNNCERQGEMHLKAYGMYVSGFSESPYGIEWMRFDPDTPLPIEIRSVPHVAFEVDDIEKELIGKEVLWPPGSPSQGVRSAMIKDNGALIELIWFAKNHPDTD